LNDNGSIPKNVFANCLYRKELSIALLKGFPVQFKGKTALGKFLSFQPSARKLVKAYIELIPYVENRENVFDWVRNRIKQNL